MLSSPVRSAFVRLATFGMWLGFCLGCQPDGMFGSVTGKILMDGEPLVGAAVEFQPEGGGRTSTALTDENGEYELRYNRSRYGAIVGQHRVMIRTSGTVGSAVIESLASPGDYSDTATPETIPMKYNVNSVLQASVQPGHNQVDFLELDSEGEIYQLPDGY